MSPFTPYRPFLPLLGALCLISLFPYQTASAQSSVTRQGQSFHQDLPQPATFPETEKAADPLAAIVAYGWQEYELKNFVQARDFFSQGLAAEDDEIRRSARYGLAYTLLQLEESDAALPLLQQLLEEEESDPQAESVAPILAGLFFARGDYDALVSLLPRLPISEQGEWQKRIADSKLQQDVQELTPKGAGQFVSRYQDLLAQCHQLESFFQAAQALALTDPARARKIFSALGRCRPADLQWQERIMRERLQAMSNAELIRTLSRSSGVPGDKRMQRRLFRESLWQRIGRVNEESRQYELLVSALYRHFPGDRKGAHLAAWNCYQQGDFDCSASIFSKLLEEAYSDDVLKGQLYSMLKLGKEAEGLQLLEKYPAKAELFREQRHDLHLALGIELFQNEEYAEAVPHLEEGLLLQSDDLPTRRMLLWSRYHLGEREPLAQFLWQQYLEEGAEDDALALGEIIGNLDDPALSEEIMASFAGSEDEQVRKIAADYAHGHGRSVQASQIYQGKETAYAGYASPQLDIFASYRYKDGDPGTSRLRASTLGAVQRFSVRRGIRYGFSLAQYHIDSGAAEDEFSVHGLEDHLRDSITTYGLQAGVYIEGQWDWNIVLGTTPLDADIEPTLVGKVETIGRNWTLAATRDSMRDSMLSWVGLTDPASGREWGRVVETSLLAGKVHAFDEWWLALEGKAGWYDGKNTERNNSLTGTVSAGRSGQWHDFQRTIGLFAYGRGFGHNENLFSYGHGGYYSPELQIVAGPFLRLETVLDSSYWLDASLSAGVNYQKTDEPLEAEETDIALNARVRGLLPIADGWFAGGEAGFNNVSDFNQWQVGVILQYRFGEGMGLGRPERYFSVFPGLMQ
ncbi:MAG: cellulose synthase subunit BcsC-related outer membrane protein [Thermodesulfobacteriota bacterium]